MKLALIRTSTAYLSTAIKTKCEKSEVRSKNAAQTVTVVKFKWWILLEWMFFSIYKYSGNLVGKQKNLNNLSVWGS